MLIGWVQLCHHDNDPTDVFRGEYWDRGKRYKGKFQYVHPQGKPVPENIFNDYYLSDFSSETGIQVYPIKKGKPPVEYFLFKVMNPEDIQRWTD